MNEKKIMKKNVLNGLEVVHTGLFPVYKSKQNNELVSLRDVHTALGVKKPFTDWAKEKIAEKNLVENRDFSYYHLEVIIKKRGPKKQDVVLKAGDAKRIAMSVNTPAGIKVQNYFLDCEQIAQTVMQPQQPVQHSLQKHISKAVQIEHSKLVNGFTFKSGLHKTIEYNNQSCFFFTGCYPKQLIASAKKFNVKAVHRTSAKCIIRNFKPVVASKMSVCDELVASFNLPFQAAALIAEQTEPFYQSLKKLGILDQPPQPRRIAAPKTAPVPAPTLASDTSYQKLMKAAGE